MRKLTQASKPPSSEGRRKQEEAQPTMTKTKLPSRKLISIKKQKVMSQMKRQDKTPEKQLNEVEIGKLPERKFRIMMVKMIQDLRKTMEKMQEMFTKDLKN